MLSRRQLDALPSEARAEALGIARRLVELQEQNPLAFFRPFEKQQRFLGSRARIKAFLGGNRSGKTTTGIADDLIQAVDADCLPESLRRFKWHEPPFYCRIISPDFTSTMGLVIFEKLRELAPKAQLRGGSWEKGYDKQGRVLWFENGSFFQFLTSEQDLDKHAGARFHRVHFDEEPPGEKGFAMFRENWFRTLDYSGQLTFTMTPLLGLSWAFDEVWERRHEDGFDCFTVATMDNPAISPEEIEETKRVIRDERELRSRLYGEFVHFGGLVLGDFDLNRHVVSMLAPDDLRGRDVVVGVDPGVEQAGVVFVCFDEQDRLIVFDELYPSDRDALPPQVAGAIRRKLKVWNVPFDEVTFVIDPSARNRNVTDGQRVESLFWQEGIHPIAGQNDISAGVIQLRRRVAQDALLVGENCTSWLMEQRRYRIKQTDGKFETVRGFDHLMDPTRYVAMTRWVGPDVDRPKDRRTDMFQSWRPDVTGPVSPTGALT